MSRCFRQWLFAVAALPSMAGGLTLTSGVDFSNYVSPDMVESSLPLALSYHTIDWGVDVSTSWLRQRRVPYTDLSLKKSDLRPIKVGGKTFWVPIRPGRSDISTDEVSGWGDTSIGVSRTYDLGDTLDAPFLTFRLALKVPTGSRDKGLSTGKYDWTLGTTWVKDMGPLSLSLGLNRNIIGRQVGIATRDTWSGDVMTGYALNDGTLLSLDYAWSQSPSPKAEGSRTLAWSTSFALNKSDHLSLTVARGYTPADPHEDFNISLSHAFR